jgi:hypothetical protein
VAGTPGPPIPQCAASPPGQLFLCWSGIRIVDEARNGNRCGVDEHHPVRLPSGWFRLAKGPIARGSPPVKKNSWSVADFAGSAAGRSRQSRPRTRPPAMAADRIDPLARPYSITTFRPAPSNRRGSLRYLMWMCERSTNQSDEPSIARLVEKHAHELGATTRFLFSTIAAATNCRQLRKGLTTVLALYSSTLGVSASSRYVTNHWGNQKR